MASALTAATALHAEVPPSAVADAVQDAQPAPSSPAGPTGTILAALREIETHSKASRYSHVTRVDRSRGIYEFDCSGLVAWVLRRTAPVAEAAVEWKLPRGRPLARDYYSRIASVRPGKERWGWQRVARVEEATAGDVIAWLKPAEIQSPNTGHVAFLVGTPQPLAEAPGSYLVRIADASSYWHAEDTRRERDATGFGMGTILVVADAETGAPRAYGWAGAHSRWVFETRIAIGRALR